MTQLSLLFFKFQCTYFFCTEEKKKRGRKKVAPDEALQYGPFQFLRYGKFVLQKTEWTESEHKKFQQHLASRYLDIRKEINDLVTEFAGPVREFNPIGLLKMAYWQYAFAQINIIEESSMGFEQIIPAQFLTYLQNVIISVPPASFYKDCERFYEANIHI